MIDWTRLKEWKNLTSFLKLDTSYLQPSYSQPTCCFEGDKLPQPGLLTVKYIHITSKQSVLTQASCFLCLLCVSIPISCISVILSSGISQIKDKEEIESLDKPRRKPLAKRRTSHKDPQGPKPYVRSSFDLWSFLETLTKDLLFLPLCPWRPRPLRVLGPGSCSCLYGLYLCQGLVVR